MVVKSKGNRTLISEDTRPRAQRTWKVLTHLPPLWPQGLCLRSQPRRLKTWRSAASFSFQEIISFYNCLWSVLSPSLWVRWGSGLGQTTPLQDAHRTKCNKWKVVSSAGRKSSRTWCKPRMHYRPGLKTRPIFPYQREVNGALFTHFNQLRMDASLAGPKVRYRAKELRYLQRTDAC